MRKLSILVLLAACGGDAADADGTTDTDGGAPGGCEVPTYDLDGLESCAQLRDAYDGTLDAADSCTTAADCRLVEPGCDLMIAVGKCWFAANGCVSDADLSAFDAAASAFASGCATTSGTSTCSCPAAGPVECVSGRCTVE